MSNLRWTIGDVKVTQVVEREEWYQPELLLPGATRENLQPHLPWLQPTWMDQSGKFGLSFHALCLESKGLKIVVDTCVGNDRVLPWPPGTYVNTPFLECMTRAGFDREEVEIVVCTHLHFDHVGWNTMLVDGRWEPTFPNARYLICRDEWDHWTACEGPVTLGETVQPVVEAGLADFVSADHSVTGEVRLEATPGHTPGHVAVRIESRGAHAIITGDLAHHPVQLAEPSWGTVVDSDPGQSEATRRRILREHGNAPTLVIGTHFPAPGAGHLVSEGDGFRFVGLPTGAAVNISGAG
jgi:glyoxylase-like metal-dependent hydrolase (beta-lactamase superfamily II)